MSDLTNENSEIGARASREGHEYHIAWAAKLALQLVYPKTNLSAIAIEGFDVEAAGSLSKEAMDIADLVQYYGGTSFFSVEKLKVLQFKYSPSRSEEGLTASDLQKTLSKFVASQNDIENEIGYAATEEKTSFQFVSNRPTGDNLKRALQALQNGTAVSGPTKKQLATLKRAIGLEGLKLNSFLDRFTITGKNSTRPGISGETYRILSQLGGECDATTRLRLLEIQNLLRQKAGCDGAPNNFITQIDVLGVLGIDLPENLYPTPDAFPKIPVILNRDFVRSLLDTILSSTRPLIIHGPGGIGKTVVMELIEKKLSEKNETILFDGFGGGSWRAPSDKRHLARNSLLHIINLLAAKNLCDLILPGTNDETIIRTAVIRLNQAVTTLRESDELQKNIFLLLDAIDHPGMRAADENSKSFAKELLKELDVNPIDGVFIVASCRTERREVACGLNDYPNFLIPVFSIAEINQLLLARNSELTSLEEAVLFSKSGGNPRCIDMMLKNGDLLNIPTFEGNEELLDVLIEERFHQAIQHAKVKGSFTPEGEAFIAGLRLLPPPVPTDELAQIFNVPIQAIDSFVSDLYPLIENTKYGLIFRDEPTETLAKKYVDKNIDETDQFISRITELQSNSSYCARALPNLLVEFDKPDDLIKLAYSNIFPKSASSIVAKRNIRLARIIAAVNGCTGNNRHDDVFGLLIEAATIANGTTRSDRYILNFPDLAIASEEPEIRRRIFESKAGWRGARFSSQSMAFAFSGFYDEAKVSSDQAIQWLNWNARQVDENGYHEHRYSDDNDEWLGAVYVKLVNGDLEHILNWLGEMDVDFASNFLMRIFDFLILHSKESESAKNCVNDIIKHACKQQISSSYCLCVILHTFSLTVQQEHEIISNLAVRISASEENEESVWIAAEYTNLKKIVLFIVIRAIKTNQRKEAKAIFSKIFCSRPKNHELGYGSTYHSKTSFWVLYCAVNAVLKSRKPNIGDFVSEEIWEKLPRSALSRGPKMIEKAIENLFEHRNNRQDVFDYQQKQELERTLEERSRTLVEFAQWASQIIHPSKKETADSFIEALSDKVEGVSNYPYQDQPLFIARIGFFTIFNATNQSPGWEKDAADQYAEWIKTSPLNNQTDLIKIVASWASNPTTHRTALNLSKHTCSLIRQETDTQTKIDDLANLARVIWHVSKYEAGEVFKLGIELADKLGSDDYFEIESIIHCAQEYVGNDFTNEELHNFCRICELNFPYDTEKFIWSGYGIALAKIGGANALPIISRLADRDVVSLQYSLGPLLSSLIISEKLSAELACPLIGLDEIAEPWTWDLSEIFASAFPTISQIQKTHLSIWVAKEYDRAYASSPPEGPLRILKSLLEENRISIPNYSHLNNLENNRTGPSEGGLKPTINQYRKIDKARPIRFDSSDFSALSHDISEELKHDSSPYATRRRCEQIIEGITNLDDILIFINHIVELGDVPLNDVLKIFETIKKDWGDDSNAVNLRISEGTLKVISQKTSDFFVEDWELGSLLRDICTFTPGQQKEALCRILNTLGTELDNFESAQWMRFAASMAKYISNTALENGIKRYIQVRGDEIPNELGDGLWSSKYKSPSSNEDIVTGFLWNQLGSAYTNKRWRAAHAVIRNAEFGNITIIENLIDKFGATDALPFHHPKYPFYYHHARLWLLIALSKIAGTNPLQLKSMSSKILKMSKLCGNHYLQKYYAVDILKKIEDKDTAFSYTKELAEQEKLLSPIGIKKQESGLSNRSDSYAGRPDTVPKPRTNFYFNYDFEKYEINHLGRLFDIHTWQVKDDMTNIISDWEGEIENIRSCPRNISSLDELYDEQQPYGYYLGYHALFEAAGRYIQKWPTINIWNDDELEDWLRQYTLPGKWLSDSTDYFPPVVPSAQVNLENYDELPTMEERKSLASQISDQRPFSGVKEINISGRWTDENGVNYKISSALVETSESNSLAYALMSQTAFHSYLPIVDNHPDPWSNRGIANPLTEIVETPSYESSRLDEYDPYGIKGADGGPNPHPDIVNDFQLAFSDNNGKNWITNNNTVMFSKLIWGAGFGRGRHRSSKEGSVLTCSLEGLKSILKKRKKYLIILVCSQKYHEHKETEHKFVNKSSVVLISPNGKIRPVQKLPKLISEATKNMHPNDRFDLIDCYEMVSRTLKVN